MSDADEGRAGASSGAAAAAPREPESPRASAPATRDVQVAAGSESPAPAHVADAPGREAESQGFGGNEGLGDGARVVVPEREARRAAPETGEVTSPYAQAATPQPVQTEDAAAAEEKRGRVARVREGTRARVENTRARVERVKGDALFALEETPDDSGLRFVAVAAALFVLFVLFLFLSVTVLR
ncbi:MAG TPA: hypothetical protein VGP08_07670 [Pyrinomonadaceae bacterium]|jgi:hypothetical protein|nr:hypothetical protein [Pyrinomonadaceae bacterium]